MMVPNLKVPILAGWEPTCHKQQSLMKVVGMMSPGNLRGCVDVYAQGMLIPTWMLFDRSHQPVPELPPCHTCIWPCRPTLCLHLPANIAAKSAVIFLFTTASACDRQDPSLNASQACSRWSLSLKANKRFGALIYLRKHHLNYQGLKGQLEMPYLIHLH